VLDLCEKEDGDTGCGGEDGALDGGGTICRDWCGWVSRSSWCSDISTVSDNTSSAWCWAGDSWCNSDGAVEDSWYAGGDGDGAQANRSCGNCARWGTWVGDHRGGRSVCWIWCDGGGIIVDLSSRAGGGSAGDGVAGHRGDGAAGRAIGHGQGALSLGHFQGGVVGVLSGNHGGHETSGDDGETHVY